MSAEGKFAASLMSCTNPSCTHSCQTSFTSLSKMTVEQCKVTHALFRLQSPPLPAPQAAAGQLDMVQAQLHSAMVQGHHAGAVRPSQPSA